MRIAAIFRYPVKSMLGEQVGESELDERGLAGDRGYAILDRDTGFIASAKHPRKWQRLLECSARYLAPPRAGAALPPVLVRLPDGTAVQSGTKDVDRTLSSFLGREVALVTSTADGARREADRRSVDASEELVQEEPLALGAPAGTFFDHAPIHVLSTSTVERVAALQAEGCLHVRRFRPNLVIADEAAESDGFVETTWLGRTMQVGGGVELHVVDPTPRCRVITLSHGQAPAVSTLLRTVARNSSAPSTTMFPGVMLPAVVGAYASARRGGHVREGDVVRIALKPAPR